MSHSILHRDFVVTSMAPFMTTNDAAATMLVCRLARNDAWLWHSRPNEEQVKTVLEFVSTANARFQTILTHWKPIVNKHTGTIWYVYTALYQAAVNGHVHVLAYLVDMAADLVANRPNIDFQACRGDRLQLLQYLSEVVRLSEKDSQLALTFAFHSAAENGYLDVVKHLVNSHLIKSFRTEAARREGTCAFRLAAANGHVDVLEYLVATFGLNVDDMRSENTLVENTFDPKKGTGRQGGGDCDQKTGQEKRRRRKRRR